jgi:hypothetical protein
MISFRTLSTPLFAAAMFSSACVVEPLEQDLTGELDVSSGDITIATGYGIDRTYHTYESFFYGEEVADSLVMECDQFDDGVVRSWHLKEVNHHDFRYSKIFCRDILADGTLGSVNDPRTHFYHDGDGTLGTAPIPLETLPVGVRLRVKYDGLGYSGYVFKIGDVALLYDSADDIYADFTGYQATSYAFGHDTGSTHTVECPPGLVMTGIGVFEDIVAGGTNRSEIRGVKIRCDALVREPIIAPIP